MLRIFNVYENSKLQLLFTEYLEGLGKKYNTSIFLLAKVTLALVVASLTAQH